jgi:hypothetical protein
MGERASGRCCTVLFFVQQPAQSPSKTHPGVRIVECHVRALTKGDTCCACAARGARPAKPVLAETYRRDSPRATDWPDRIVLCAECAAAQHREELRDRRRRLLALAGTIAALAAVFVPRAPRFSLVIVAVAVTQVFAWLAHERSLRGARLAAVVLSCDGEEMRVQLVNREALKSDSPLVRGDFGAHSSALFAASTLVIIALAYPLWALGNPDVTFVSRLSDSARVFVDGRELARVQPVVSTRARLSFGEHQLTFSSDPALPSLAFRNTLAGETTVRLALPACDDPETGETRPHSLRWRNDRSLGYVLECDFAR